MSSDPETHDKVQGPALLQGCSHEVTTRSLVVALQRARDVLGAQGETWACLPLLCGLQAVSGPLHHPLPLHRVIAQLHRLGEAQGEVVGLGGLLQATRVAPGLSA